MMTRKLAFAATTALALAAASAAYAQETTSAVRGEVIGSDGAPVAGATIVVLHQPSGTRATTVSDDAGLFDARGLRVGGPYSLSVSAPGYEARSLDGVFLTLGQTTRLDVDLKLEGMVEELVVTASADPTAGNTSTRTTLDAQDVQSVVSVTRDIRDLARRSPLVTQNSRGDGGISIAGSNPRTNRITIDGAQAQDDFGLNTGGTPTRRGPVSLDAVEQFTVDAVPVDVENGDFQGGALDVVLKSGANAFHGSVFDNYLNDGMVGDKVRTSPVASKVTQTNYGGFISGPILRDRVFFAASYELYESADITATGPTGAAFANAITGVTQATIDQVVGIYNTNYLTDFAAGGIPSTKPITDEKYTLKLDWNINESHRASLTARYALSEVYQRTNLSRTSAGLDSQWYLSGEEDYSYVGQLDSHWTDRLTTQLRMTYRDYERRQLPPSGQDFSDVSVCTSPTSINSGGDNLTSCGTVSVVRFGPDEFRQANELETDNLQFQAKAEYSLGTHLFKVGYQAQRQGLYNLFIPTSDGVYYFDSIADFTAGNANRLRFADSIGGQTTQSSAAQLEYWVHSAFAQDSFDVNDELRITAGARYDTYVSDSLPVLNTNFVTRNGFNNQATYDGRSVLMPRISFDWRPLETVKIAGGAGIFSGGVPDVLLSNPYGNGSGVRTTGIDIQRTAGGFTETTGTPGFTTAIGQAALNNLIAQSNFGYDVPTSVRTFQGGGTPSALNEVAAFSPAYQIPRDWKFFLSGQWDVADGWRLGIDVVKSKVDQAVLIKDTRAQALIRNGVQQRLPDGRLRYDAVTADAATRLTQGVTSTNPGSSNRDLVVFNTDQGEGISAAFSVSKSFDFGMDMLVSYTYQDVNDASSSLRFSSTQSSSYQSPAGIDPNAPAYGNAYDEITDSFKLNLSYEHRFIGDLATRITLFGERRTGRPTSFVMGDATTGRGPVFGVNRGTNHLLYVPDIEGDTNTADLIVGLVTFDSTATRDNFLGAVDRFGLPNNAIVPKGFYRNHDINLLDVQVSQDLPGLRSDHRFRLVFDLQNVLNLINPKWGIVDEYFDVDNVVSVSCLDSAGATPSAGSPNGGVFACDRYRYSSFQSSSVLTNIDTAGRSLWTLQVGLRYEF